jgi:hypothetical protein
VTAVDSEAAFLLTSVNYLPGIAAVAVDLTVRGEKEIGDLWAYLKQFGADGKKSMSFERITQGAVLPTLRGDHHATYRCDYRCGVRCLQHDHWSTS